MPTLAENRKAHHDYTILDALEAGIVLSGQEVKSAKSGQINLKGSFIHLKNGEAFLTNAYIAPYQKAAGALGEYDPYHNRKLLLSKKEIAKILERKDSEGVTVIPLSVYTKSNFIKVKVGIARGKKKYEKREAIKKREVNREIRRYVK